MAFEHSTNLAISKRKFILKCTSCGREINEMIDGDFGCIASGQYYHLKCFTCAMCGTQINPSDGLFYIVDGLPYCKKDYISNGVCCTCGTLIMDSKMLQAPNGDAFHPKCFQCSSCQKCLDGVQYIADKKGRVHCTQCFHRKYSPKCADCKKPIVYEDTRSCLQVEDTGDYYHVNCYKCSDCGLRLSSEIPGMECYPLNDRPYCKTCHVEKKKSYGLDVL